jgi:hypothetical protein
MEKTVRRLKTKITLNQLWRSYGTQKCFLGTRHSLLSQFLYIFSPTGVSIVKNIYLYTLAWLREDFIWITVATKYYSGRNNFTQIESGGKCWLVIYHWCSDLAATGRICDSGQRVLKFSLQTGRSSSPSSCHIFFPIAFLEENFIRNIIILALI